LVSQSRPWWVHWQHKSTKFEFHIQDIWSTARRPKAKKKTQEGHLEGKIAKPANGAKSGKPRKNGKEELRKAQNQENLKTQAQTQNSL
jgi:hypothetical protein